MANNNLRVIYNKIPENQKKKGFAVCVKGLDFPQEDLSVRFFLCCCFWGVGFRFRKYQKMSTTYKIFTRLVEWFELLTALGAEKTFLYNMEVHPNVTKVWIFHRKYV